MKDMLQKLANNSQKAIDDGVYKISENVILSILFLS